MDFSWTAEQIFVRNTLRKFIQRELSRDKVHELDEQGNFPSHLLNRIAEMGLCALNTPEDFEGGGPDLPATVMIMEEIAAVSPALALLFASTSLFGGRVLTQFGSLEQQKELFPQVIRGALKFVLVHAAELARAENSVRVSSDEHGLRLNGRVGNVLLSELCDFFIVPAFHGELPETECEVTLLLVPRNSAGLTVKAQPSLGLRGAGLGEVSFEHVLLTPGQVLGGPENIAKGRQTLETLLALEHISAAAIGLGLTQGAYEYALNYARERAQFGQTLLHFEAIENMLVELAVSAQAARWMLYHACWQADQGKPFWLEAAMARLQAGSLARQAGLQCVHILGGYGYMAEYDAQRMMRDALVLFPGAESSEVLKTKIGRQIHNL